MRSAARLDDAWNCIAVSDVIVLDLGLPDADGLETLVAARELAGNAPIVVLTGSEDADIGQRALRAGADGFVSKRRADPAILHAVLRRAITARATRARRRACAGTPLPLQRGRARGQLIVDRLLAVAIRGLERAQLLRERVDRRVRLAHVAARLLLEHGVGAVGEPVVERGDLLGLAGLRAASPLRWNTVTPGS